jgi:hypothetical protein
MDTITAIHSRRSIRDYESRSVPRGIIEEILFDAAQAPRPPSCRSRLSPSATPASVPEAQSRQRPTIAWS